MTKRNKWTEDEILFLKNNYEKIGAKKTNEILSGHTYLSVVKTAHKLKLKVDKAIYHYDLSEIINVIKNSTSIADVFRKLNKTGTGDSYKIFKKIIINNNIDISHFDPYKNNRIQKNSQTIFFWLQNGTNISSNILKHKLYKEGLKERKCEKCGQGEDWNGEHMSLILDHINGINNDNRLENLRIVCPNCNATLPTHCRGNKVKKEKVKKLDEKLFIVKKEIKTDRLNNGFTLNEINGHLKERKVERPSYPQLISEIKELGYRGTGKKYGVSDNAIRKWKYIYEKYN